jgi:hypothetical protein
MIVDSSGGRDCTTAKTDENSLSQAFDLGLDLHRSLVQKVPI